MSSAKRSLKLGIFVMARALGLFAVARMLTARRLRILCYHGVGTDEDVAFAPGLFMTLAHIRSRFAILRRGPYKVLSLSDAVDALQSGRLPRLPVVITFDDGFAGNVAASRALREEFNLPMTLYVTTYYVVKQTPIFRHAVRYMLWKSNRATLATEDLSSKLSYRHGIVDLRDRAAAEKVIWPLVTEAECHLSEAERVELSRELGRRLGVDYEEIAHSRRLSLLSVPELRQLSDIGVDIQLHTHRHWMPTDADALRREITENRAVLEPAIGHAAVHLCYPSGVYSVDQWPVLAELGVRSATTCEPGSNDPEVPSYGLRRFLDGQSLSALEFEAELSGFTEILRSVPRLARRERSASRGVAASVYGH